MKPNRKPRRHRIEPSTADEELDALVPSDLHHLSRAHWTPVEIAVRAVTLLCPAPRMTILDVGAGVGKLCVIGAMSSWGVWCGIERHGSLVDSATRLARTLGVTAYTSFIHGDAFSIDWGVFDAIYLYNPFELAPFPTDPARHALEFRVQVAQVQDRLAALPDGVRVVTLHGFGGAMPASYQLVYQERFPAAGLDLVLWVQRARARARRAVREPS
ncbi:MAG TPA: class I SAM-dependent methyltransferase [Kofleriaceae bacterium]